MKMTREKKILLSLLMCGAVCNVAYANDPPTNIDTDQDWVIGTGEGQYQFNGGEYTLGPGVTVTMTETEAHSNTGTEGDALIDNNGTPLTITGSADSDGNLSKLIIYGHDTGAETAILAGNVTLKDVDLEIHNYEIAMGGTGSIAIENDNITVAGSGSFYNGTGSLTVNTGVLDVTIADAAEHDVTYGIYWSRGGLVNITADTISFKSSVETANTGYGIFASYGSAYDTAPITLTGNKISIDGFGLGIDLQQYAKVYINHTGTGEENTLDIVNSNYHGYDTGSGIFVETYSSINIASNGIINISNNGLDGLTVFASSAANSGHSEDSRGATITGQGDTVINFDGNVEAGIFAYGTYSVLIQNVDAINISNTPDGDGLYLGGSASFHGIDIENVNTMTIDTTDIGIENSSARYGINITNVGDLTVQNSGTGIYSTGNNGVNVTVADEGSVTLKDNGTGIQTNRVDGVTIKGVSGDYAPKLEISGNTKYGLYVYSGGTLDFSANELEAKDNAILAYATGTGTGGSDDDGNTYDSHSSAINLTADKATITGQTEDSSGGYTLYAESGGTITLNVGDITASRDSGYFAYADTNTASTINITADTGTIKGAFWTGDTGKTDASDSGTINLNLGTSTEWTVTDNSKVTELTLGDDSGLVFSYLGAEGGTGDFLNLYTSSMASGNGSNITMNINGGALDQSDHIYVNGEHSGSSVINLVGNGTDLTDDVIGTRLVSVVTESGSFTAGAKYEGALVWYDYTLNHVDNGATADLSNGKTVTNTDGYNTDWYIESYAETDEPDTNPNPEPDPEPTPDPDKPDDGGGDGGPGPAQPDGNTTTVNTVIASNAVNYYAFRETDKLLRRMGELRNNGEDEQGIWIRVKGAKTGRDNSFENKYTHYEMGYDTLVKNDHREKRYEGFSLSYMEGDVKYSGVSGSGKAHDEEIAFYRVDQYTHGHYLDLVARIGMYSNRFGVYDTNQNKIHGKNDTYGISMSAEYGRKKDYAHGWYIEPQMQATIGYLSGNDYTTSNQVDVNNGSISSLVGRIGANFGKNFGREKKGIVYLKANWLHEFLGSYSIDMVSNAGNRVHAHGDYRDNWFEYGLGVAYKYTKNNFVYADIERTSGSDYYKNWAWNVGLRWTFN